MMGAGGGQRSEYQAAAQESINQADDLRGKLRQVEQAIETYRGQVNSLQEQKATLWGRIQENAQASINSILTADNMSQEQKAAYISQIKANASAQYSEHIAQIQEAIGSYQQEIQKLVANAQEIRRAIELYEGRASSIKTYLAQMAGQQTEAVHAESSSNRA